MSNLNELVSVVKDIAELIQEMTIRLITVETRVRLLEGEVDGFRVAIQEQGRN